mmetsp:Transcript_82599/g.215579  ORF Transcript_82599/g.215579 Transcript_82599/m.215579 type:complete len:398 (+) Transcript_82599:57-1250(+)
MELELDAFLGKAQEDQEAAAATQIQAAHRGRSVRKSLQDLKAVQVAAGKEAAATQIQAAYRGKVVRQARGREPDDAHDDAAAREPGPNRCGAERTREAPRQGEGGSELERRLARARSRANTGQIFESRPADHVADAKSEWIAFSGAQVGWDEVHKVTAVDLKRAPGANASLRDFFSCAPVPVKASAAPAGPPSLDGGRTSVVSRPSVVDWGPIAEDSDSSSDLAAWDDQGSQERGGSEDVSGQELRELVSQLRGRSEEESRALVKALPWGKAMALARLVVQARRVPKKKGWLSKRGPSSSYGWQQRWVVLSHSGIDYFADDAEKQRKGDIRFGPETRAVAFGSFDEMPRDHGHPFGFVVVKAAHPDVGGLPRLFYFEAQSEEDMREWMDTINAMGQP